MSRKDYEAFASRIRAIVNIEKADVVQGAYFVAKAFADMAQLDNAQFDRARFMKACGLEKF